MCVVWKDQEICVIPVAAMWGFPNAMGFALNARMPKESCSIASLAIYPFIGIACPACAGV